MSPLQRLILDRMRERQWTPKQVEHRGVAHATLHRYMNPVQMSSPPRKGVMQSLANALDLDVAEVERAAVASVGYSYKSQDPDAAPMTDVPEAIRRDSRLLPEARQHLLNQYQLLLRIQALSPEALAEQEERRTAEDEQAQVYAEDHADLDETRAQQERGEPTRLTEKRRTRRIR